MIRSTILPILKKCDVCQRQLMTRQFHVFPCHHAFHSDCVVDQLLLHPIKATRVKYLSSLVLADPNAKGNLENFLGEECVLCSEIMIRTVDLEFTSDPGRL
jgi:vacuolar protein sorting-associated protein 18